MVVKKLKTKIMSKKEFSSLVLSLGGQPEYSGKDRIMYIHNLSDKARGTIKEIISKCNFKIVFE